MTDQGLALAFQQLEARLEAITRQQEAFALDATDGRRRLHDKVDRLTEQVAVVQAAVEPLPELRKTVARHEHIRGQVLAYAAAFGVAASTAFWSLGYLAPDWLRVLRAKVGL